MDSATKEFIDTCEADELRAYMVALATFQENGTIPDGEVQERTLYILAILGA